MAFGAINRGPNPCSPAKVGSIEEPESLRTRMTFVEILIKIVAPIVAVASIVLNVVQYRRGRRVDNLNAEKELVRLQDIEWGRLEARHTQERRDLLADCEGEIRRRDNITVNTLTAEDNRRLSEQFEEQQREWRDLLNRITYYQRILGQEGELLLQTVTIWHRIRWWSRRVLRRRHQ